jgi:iron(III) transport system ATP-binding protein
MGLRLEGIRHRFGPHVVFDDLNLRVGPGEIVCLLGPSGCGKTTLLRIAAGLERQAAGTVWFNDVVVSDATRHVPPEARNVGLMFQDFALFPHLTVAANVAFGIARLPAAERDRRVARALAQVGMTARAATYPHTLSGGQQQRVALARALAPQPSVMLLDEPFSGLDQSTRIQIREETLGILKDSGVATLMVTHHPEEGMFMADRMLVMGPHGHILQEGTPHEVYGSPADAFVASFFGQVNRLDGVARGGVVETALGSVPVPGVADGTRIEIVFREYAVELTRNGAGESVGTPVEILNARPLGRNTFVRFRLKTGAADGAVFRCRFPGAFPATGTDEVRARIIPEHAFVYRMDGA